MAKKVFLSAGHGGTDPGAVGNGLQEKDINLQIMLACREELVRHGLDVNCSRLKDENDPVSEEVAEANASGADIAVSFHTNAGGGDGSETFYWESSAEGKRLAELCEKHVQAIGQNSRGVKTNNLMFTRETKMVAVLCECAFIDNKGDIDIADTVAEQKKFGVAYAKAILEYLGIAYKEEGQSTSVEQKPTTSTYTGNSIVDYLNSVGIDSSFANRKKLAAQYGINNYSGTADQNLTLLNKMRDGSKPVTSKVSYYKAFSSTSIVDGLKSIGVDSSFSNRKKIASANGISNYTGTAEQNEKLLSLAKQGKLKK